MFWEISKAIAKGIVKQLPIVGPIANEIIKVFEKQGEIESMPSKGQEAPPTLMEDASNSLSLEEEEKEEMIADLQEIMESPGKSDSERVQEIVKKVIDPKTKSIASDYEAAIGRAKKFSEPDRRLTIYLLGRWIEAKEKESGVFIFHQGDAVIQIREAKEGIHWNIMCPPLEKDKVLAMFGGKCEEKKTAVQPKNTLSESQIDQLLEMLRKQECSPELIIKGFSEDSKKKILKLQALWQDYEAGNKFLRFVDSQKKIVFRICPNVIHVLTKHRSYMTSQLKEKLLHEFGGEERAMAIKIPLGNLALEKIDAFVKVLREA